MFARILEYDVNLEKKDEFLRMVKNEIVPILKKQTGFLEVLPFFEDIRPERVVTISLWNDRRDVEKYERETFYRVHEIMKPFLKTPIQVRPFVLEASICQHFVQAMAA